MAVAKYLRECFQISSAVLEFLLLPRRCGTLLHNAFSLSEGNPLAIEI